MEVKLQLCVFMLLIDVSLAVSYQTVFKGQTLTLHCPLTKPSQNHPVEWKNPNAMRDKRYSLQKLSQTEYNIRISNVTFSDGGTYTCSQYLYHTKNKKVEVTVLDEPQIHVTTHEGRNMIKCTAEANYPPPQISWMFKNGAEFETTHQPIICEDKKCVSISRLTIQASTRVITVKCIVRHPSLHSRTLIDFVKIKPSRPKPGRRASTTISLPWTTPAPETTKELTTEPFTATLTEEETANTEFSTATSYFSSSNTEKTTESPSATSPLSSSGGSTVLPDLPTTQNHTSRISNSTDRTSVAVTTFNDTRENRTGDGYDVERREGHKGNTSLLVFLVTCLIFGLLVVVIFIGIKLRRAHLAWKRENEDSDTSEASSKSKSSQEEKNAQKKKGFFSTGCTQYVQEPTVITSVTNPPAMTSTDIAKEQQPPPTQLPERTIAKSNIKETEL